MTHTDLARALGISDTLVIDKLMVGISDANNCQHDLSTLYKPRLNIKQMREEMEKLQRALKKVTAGKGKLEAANNSIAAALKEIPEKWLQYLDTLDPALEAVTFDPAKTTNSGFYWQALSLWSMTELERQKAAERLLAVVSEFLDDMRTPGKGNARKQVQRYIPGIQCLMSHFQAALPDRKVSSKSSSTFYKYAHEWLDQFESISSPDPYIEAAIADLAHWKKISL